MSDEERREDLFEDLDKFFAVFRHTQLAHDMFSIAEDARIDGAIAKTRAFYESLGIRTRLSDYGVKVETAAEVARRLNARGMVQLGERGASFWADLVAAGADVDAVADDGRAGVIAVLQADGDAIAEDHVVADHGVAADDNVAEVFDAEAASDDARTAEDAAHLLRGLQALAHVPAVLFPVVFELRRAIHRQALEEHPGWPAIPMASLFEAMTERRQSYHSHTSLGSR